jgi:multidrug efflux pump subunit AcrB
MVDPKEPPHSSVVVFDRHLLSPDQYKKVILKADPEGNIVRLKDVAKVELVAAAPGAAPDRRGK